MAVNLSSSIEEISITHIIREANYTVDSLANLGHGIIVGLCKQCF